MMIERTVRGALVAAVLVTFGILAGSAPEAWASGSSADAKKIVDAMIEAHGGMEHWASAATVSFTDEFRPGGGPSGAPSHITVDQNTRRVYIDYPGTPMRLAWDGEKAWTESWMLPYPPRFLALLNYYFFNLPWLTQDPGVILGETGTGTLPGDDTEYRTVMMTFESGVGDTPDDYYRLYIHPESHRLAGTDYTVTYSALLPEGVESSTPNTLVYDEWATVDGLVVPTHYTIYQQDGTVFGTCASRDWSFDEPFDEARMTMPEGAAVDPSTP